MRPREVFGEILEGIEQAHSARCGHQKGQPLTYDFSVITGVGDQPFTYDLFGSLTTDAISSGLPIRLMGGAFDNSSNFFSSPIDHRKFR